MTRVKHEFTNVAKMNDGITLGTHAYPPLLIAGLFLISFDRLRDCTANGPAVP